MQIFQCLADGKLTPDVSNLSERRAPHALDRRAASRASPKADGVVKKGGCAPRVVRVGESSSSVGRLSG
jgi:hypothetical protein